MSICPMIYRTPTSTTPMCSSVQRCAYFFLAEGCVPDACMCCPPPFTALGPSGLVDHGVHAFVVPLRDDAGRCLPGVEIHDCGYKVGAGAAAC